MRGSLWYKTDSFKPNYSAYFLWSWWYKSSQLTWTVWTAQTTKTCNSLESEKRHNVRGRWFKSWLWSQNRLAPNPLKEQELSCLQNLLLPIIIMRNCNFWYSLIKHEQVEDFEEKQMSRIVSRTSSFYRSVFTLERIKPWQRSRKESVHCRVYRLSQVVANGKNVRHYWRNKGLLISVHVTKNSVECFRAELKSRELWSIKNTTEMLVICNISAW